MSERLEAAGGLTLSLDGSQWRLSWGEADWLGPIGIAAQRDGVWFKDGEPSHLEAVDGRDALGGFRRLAPHWDALTLPIHVSARAYRETPLVVFRIEARAALHDVATGRFAEPSVVWPLLRPAQRYNAGVADGTRTYGHQYTEFALPVSGDANATGFAFAPHRPPVVMPLLFIAPDGRTLLLAPLDHFHEQVIAVPSDHEHVDDGVRCGWHGDLAEIPAGFATELALWAADSPRHALAAWADLLLQRHGTQRPSRYVDDLLGKLSYWTDNGAVYYYRTEPACDYTTTLERVVANLHAHDIPVRALQIDSWFYPHQHLRKVSAEGAPVVPPSGMMTWEPRADLFPDGFGALRTRAGNLPLTFHSRHFSSQSPYLERYAAWTDGDYAHPSDPALFDRLMAQAASWGAITYEQDWLVESFLGVRGLRAAPGRARAWQEALDRAAGAHGLNVQWCMATPADFMRTVTLRHVASIRTSGDYRYLFDNGLNWMWFLHTNALARALGLHPFKDVFLSHGATPQSAGEPYAEIEALLSALSTGPVAIGDQLGHADRDLIMRTCREDGVLIKPDVPIAALDRCFRANSFGTSAPLIGECYSTHPAGRWVYVASFNVCQAKQPMTFRVDLTDLGDVQPEGPVLAYDWRRRTWARVERDGSWEVTLDFQDWDFRVLCPVLPGEVAVFGDVTKYAPVGDRRVAGITTTSDGIELDVLGAPDTLVEIHGWSAASPRAFDAWQPGALRTLPIQGPSLDTAPERTGPTRDERNEPHSPSQGWSWSAASGAWVLRVDVGHMGRVRVGVGTN